MSGNARFTRGPLQVRVTRRTPAASGLVAVTCAADPDTSGYKLAYRGTTDQAIACLENSLKELYRIRNAGIEPPITREPPQ